jgi:hypothetical protein
MASFAERYRDAYASLGHELKSRDGLREDRLETAEGRLGVRLPDALRDYFLVAGKERRFNQGNSRFLAPDDWFIDRRRLAFMAENQGVSFWGVQATADPAADPPVFQGVEGETNYWWHREHEQCSTFLLFMLVCNATFGGVMRYTGDAPVPRRFITGLKPGWPFVGQMNKMRAYARPGQAFCYMPESTNLPDLPGIEGLAAARVYAGATTKRGLSEMAKSLGLDFGTESPG